MPKLKEDITVFNFKEKFIVKRYYLVLDRNDVLTAIEVINKFESWYVGQNLAVGNCGWANEPYKWFIHFTAPVSKWRKMIGEFTHKNFELLVKEPEHLDVIRRV